MKTYHFLLLTISALCLSFQGKAQKEEKEPMSKLAFMTGNWQGTSTSYKDDGTSASVKAQEHIQYIMDSTLITLDLNSPSLRLHTVIRYDYKEKTYYYNPFTKSSQGSYKGFYEDGKFMVYFSETRRLTFTLTDKGQFHEYGEKLVNDKWTKYFEDILDRKE